MAVLAASFREGLAGGNFPQGQERLDAALDRLTDIYVPSDFKGKLPYFETKYPESFRKDGRGPLKTVPSCNRHCTSLSDDEEDVLNFLYPALEKNPGNKRALNDVIQVLCGGNHFTRVVPFMDRYRAAGGELDYRSAQVYIPGLTRLGRFDEAFQLYAGATLKWGTMAGNIAAGLFRDQFIYCWASERNFKNMLTAWERGMLYGINPGDANYIETSLVDLLRQSAQRQDLPWFLARLDKHWIWFTDSNLGSIIDLLQKAGIAVPDSLVTAKDPMFKGGPVTPEALDHRARTSLNKGDAETAVRQAMRALELAKASSPGQYINSLKTVVTVLRQRGELEQAYEYRTEYEKVAAESKDASEVGWATFHRGQLYDKLADFRKAADALLEAKRIGEKLNYWELTFTADQALARALIQSGNPQLVEGLLREWTEESVLHFPSRVPLDFSNLGLCLNRMGRYNEALEAFRRAMAPVRDAGAGYKTELAIQVSCLRETGYALLAKKVYVQAEKTYDDYAALAKQAMTASSGWVWQLGKAKAKLGQGDQVQARHWIDECLKSIESERANLKDFKHRRTINDNKYEAYELAIRMFHEAGDPVSAFRVAEQSRARTFLDEMGAHSPDGRATAAIVEFPALVTECRNDAIVIYYQLPDRLLAWVVCDGRPELVTLPATPLETDDAIRGLLGSIYRQSMLLKNQAGSFAANNAVEAAKRAYRLFWSPLAQLIPAGKRVCIIPHRSMHYVPFQALHDGEKYLIQKYDLFYAPSASAYVELRHRGQAANESVAVFDPILSDDPKSPFAKTESEPLKTQYPTGTFVLKDAATVSSFRETAAKAGILHISSHGYYNSWIPMDSGLVFQLKGKPGELLKAKDIYAMKFDRTQIVIMSACVSSVGDLAGGDEVTGLTRAFQVAGIPNVIGSLWPVENDATVELMTIFHRALSETHDPLASLRRAQSEMIGKGFSMARWAAFQLTGDGRRFAGAGK